MKGIDAEVIKMKKITCVIAVFCILLCNDAFAKVRDIQDNHQVIYHVIDGDGNHVGSETVALAIMKASNSQWLDFNDDTFKASGWTSKTVNLTEDSTNGFYYYIFDPSASETSAEEYVFLADNASATYGDHQSETVTYQNIGTGTSTLIASDNIGINWADVAAPTTTVGLTNTTISTSQAITSVSGSVGSVAAGVTVSTNNDKTGYSIADSTSDAVIADAVWNALVASYGSANTYGALVETNLDTTIGSRSSHAAADIWSVSTRILTALDEDDTSIDLDGTTVGGLTTWDKSGYSLSAVGIDAFWDELQSGHTNTGTFGKYLDAQVSSVGGDSAAAVWAYGTRILTALDEDDTSIDLDGTTVGGLTTWDKTGYTLSEAGIDGIWNEVITGHATEDSFGKVFDDQIDGLRTYGDSNWATATGFPTFTVTDIWNKDISGYSGVGYAGTYLKNLYDNQDWDVWDDVTRTLTAGTKDTEIDDIKTKTDQLIFTTANKVDARIDYVGANAVTTPGDFKADVSDLDVAVSTRSSHTAANVWSVSTRILTALDEDDTSIDLDGTTVGGLTTWDKSGYSLSAVGIDAFWDELQSGHTNTGTFGINLDATVSTRAQPSDVQIYVGQ